MSRAAGLVVDAACAEWGAVIREPTGVLAHGAARIDAYIRSPLGGGWPSARLPKNPRDTVAYTRDGQVQWCGFFAAWCYGMAGAPRGPRFYRFPSTPRLASRQARLGPPLPRVALGDLQPGDVLVVGNGKKPAGDHITIVLSVRDGLVYTVEGNARGKLGDGSIGEGVICRTRPLVALPASARCPVSGLAQSMHAMLAYRPEVPA